MLPSCDNEVYLSIIYVYNLSRAYELGILCYDLFVHLLAIVGHWRELTAKRKANHESFLGDWQHDSILNNLIFENKAFGLKLFIIIIIIFNLHGVKRVRDFIYYLGDKVFSLYIAIEYIFISYIR